MRRKIEPMRKGKNDGISVSGTRKMKDYEMPHRE